VGVVAAAAAVLAGVIWAASTSLQGAAPAVRVSRRVTKEEPGLVGRLLGAKPRFHVTVPEGSTLRVRLETPLSSETASPGQEITGSTSTSLVVDGFEAFPAGSRVKGHVAHAAGSGKVSGRGELTLEFDRIVTPGGTESALEAEPLQKKARSTVKKDVAKVAGAVGLGALVGASWEAARARPWEERWADRRGPASSSPRRVKRSCCRRGLRSTSGFVRRSR